MQQGFLRGREPIPGVYVGEGVVTNIKGKAYLPLFNTTNKAFDIDVPTLAIEEYDVPEVKDDENGNCQIIGSDDVSPLSIVSPFGSSAVNPLGGSSNSFTGSIDVSPLSLVSLFGSNDVNPISRSSNSLLNPVDEENALHDLPNLTKSSLNSVGKQTISDDILISNSRINLVNDETSLFMKEPLFSINNESEIFINDIKLNMPPERPGSRDEINQVMQLLQLDHLNSEEHKHVQDIVEEHVSNFHLPGKKLHFTNILKHSIKTTDEVPIHVKQYRFPPVHKDEINRQVTELLGNDIIETSMSPYNSPVWIVPKKSDSQGNKKWRMVIDFRGLNEKTIGDGYPLPNITDILDQLGEAQYFTTLDLASGFHQIEMDKNDAHKTAFSTPYGHYQFKRMPFGLKNAPATFQRLMDCVLSGLQGLSLFVYLDDIVIYAKTLEEHKLKFSRLISRLANANLKLQPDKCKFLHKEVIYLGHIICDKGVKPDPEKIRAVREFPIPKTPKNIKQFLGLAGYYRRFIPNFSKVAKPLTDLLKKDKPFVWGNNQLKSFEELKDALCTEPILQYPNFNETFNITTDASNFAIGGVLSQGKIGKDLPVSYTSRLLHPAEQNYSTIEKECLAIVYCISTFRPYVYGKKFKIITDHKPLVWLSSAKDKSSRLWGWYLKLSDYEFEIIYKPGKANSNADALSRNPVETKITKIMTMKPKSAAEKIMLRMGYQPGHGLGKHSDGMREPVEAVKYPPRTSLDFCMKIQNDKKRVLPINPVNDSSSESLFSFPPNSDNAVFSPPVIGARPFLFPETNTSIPTSNQNDETQDLSLPDPPTAPPTPTRDQDTPTQSLPRDRVEGHAFTPPHQQPETVEAEFDMADLDGIVTMEAIDTDSSSSSNSDEELFENPNPSYNLTTIPTNRQSIKLAETRETLLMRKDNHVIFISMRGLPVDKGAKEYKDKAKLPTYKDLTFERAKVTEIGTKHLIALPIKNDSRTPIEPDSIELSLKSLLDVVRELNIKSVSIAKTEPLDDIPWKFIKNKIKSVLERTEIVVVICKGLIKEPDEKDRLQIIEENHCSAVGGHKGVNKTYQRIKQHFYWGTLKIDIQKFIQNCRTCQLKKLVRVKTKQPMILTDTPGSAFDKVAMDIVGPLNTTRNQNTYILTMQDLLTKYSVAVPLEQADSISVANAFLKNFICKFGAPKAILTDQGSSFLSSLMKHFAKKFKIKQFKTTAYHPQSNGSIERSHHVLAEYLKMHATKTENWDHWLDMAMFSYNTSVHEGTKYTPYELVYGRIARQPASDPPIEENTDLTYQEYLIDLYDKISETQKLARENLIASKERSKHYYDKRINEQNFNVNDEVFVLKEPQKGKFTDQYEGPYKIVKVLDNHNLQIELPDNKTRIIHTNKVRISKLRKD